MKRRLRWLWTVAYAFCALGPAVLMSAATPPGTTPLTAAADAFGLIGLSVLGLQLVLPARWGPLTDAFGSDRLVRLHRPLATAGAVLVGLHIELLMIDDPSRLSLFVVLASPWRAKFAVLATAALGGLIWTSVARARLGLRYEHWRWLHLVLGVVLVVGATVHALLVGHYLAGGPVRLAAVALLALALFGVLFLRVGRPLFLNRRYRVTEVRAESADTITLQLRAEGHAGLPFAPGQFAWLKTADRRFALSEHPFSFATSAHRPREPAFTIRRVGDFTRQVHRLAGAEVVLDGPHGGWSPVHPDRGLLLLVGGIGITPAMSVLRTLADEAASPPVTLVYASRDPDAVVFGAELERLQRQLPLRVVHVSGRGSRAARRVDAALLRSLPGLGTPDVLICGSPGFTAAALRATDEIGIPRNRVHDEGFALA
jgi:predicted ferric reductase